MKEIGFDTILEELFSIAPEIRDQYAEMVQFSREAESAPYVHFPDWKPNIRWRNNDLSRYC